MKKIGILDLSGSPIAANVPEYLVGLLEKKQFVSLTPQAISVWCRQLGHRVYYATYYGSGDPKRKLPSDLDIVFISAHSNSAPLAYALSKVYRLEGTRTVIGGPHAKSYPRDALRYFDLVVLECDRALIEDIIADRFEPKSIISSPKPYDDTPTIEERLPEIKASVFWNGKPWTFSLIPMLASAGCPYACDFCTDWNSQYRPLSSERLAEDLRYAAENLPGVILFFGDPNFGVRFDETLCVFETIPPGRRSPYSFETSLTNLRSADRLKRLRETHCVALAPGIESWTDYSYKTGVGQAASHEKLDRVIEHLSEINQYVPYIQTNFIFGFDTDVGEEPFEVTKEFLLRSPFVFPTLNTLMAFGGTPLYNAMLRKGRILKRMPFSFYVVPYLTLILKNYDPITYFRKMVDLYSVLFSVELLKKRLTVSTPRFVKAMNIFRTLEYRGMYDILSHTVKRMQCDPQYLAFHAGESTVLPEFYATAYKRQLGKYAEIMPIEESAPVFDGAPPTDHVR
jgi:radical SAM superfamily enzyme YgiQ (UPF0313 family)